MVSVWRTTAKVWTASNASVPGVSIRSPRTLGITGVTPWTAIRAFLGPARMCPARKALRTLVAPVTGSHFHINTRAPLITARGIGVRTGVPVPRVARRALRCSRYWRVGVGTRETGSTGGSMIGAKSVAIVAMSAVVAPGAMRVVLAGVGVIGLAVVGGATGGVDPSLAFTSVSFCCWLSESLRQVRSQAPRQVGAYARARINAGRE